MNALTRLSAMLINVSLAACEQPSASELPRASVVEMVKAGDARACADIEVQKTATVLLTRELTMPSRLGWSSYLFERKLNPRFDAVSMVGVDPEISEVECSATWLLSNERHPLIYKVRPPADGTQDFVVQVDTNFSPDSITEALEAEVNAAGTR